MLDIDDGSSDNCGIDTMVLDITDFTCADLGDNTVTLIVTDNEGNSETETATVTIEDNILPTAVVQDLTVTLDASGMATVLASAIDNGSADNCGIDTMVLNISDFTCDDIGLNIVVLTVTDISGNSQTASAIVTVEDTSAATIVTQDITVELDANGVASIDVSDINNGSSDNCGIDTMVLDITDFTCADLGDNTVALTITDNEGNTNTATAIVNVVDVMGPVVTNCPEDIAVVANELDIYVIEDYTNGLLITDNCSSSFTVTQTPLSGTEVTEGDTNVVITVTDDNGNSTTCSFSITATLSTRAVVLPELKLYPNPAKEFITIVKSSGLAIKSVTIYDLTGRKVQVINFNNSLNSTEINISLNDLQIASYILHIQGENGLEVFKRIIKN